MPRLVSDADSRWKRRTTIVVGALFVMAIFSGAAWWVAPWFLKWQVRRTLASRQYATASGNLSLLESWFGRDGESCFLRARLYRKSGDWSGVHEALLQARNLKYPVDRLEREQWLTLAQSGQLRAAEPFLPKLLTNPGGDGAEICEAYVNGYFVNYRMVDALRLLDAWIADYPKDAEPRLIRGKIRTEQQFLKEAADDLRSAVTLDPNSNAARLELADVLILQRQIEPARRLYQQVSARTRLMTRATPQSKPTNIADDAVRARIGEAKALRLLNRPQQARDMANSILDANPVDREALLECGLADLELNHPEDALAELKQALQLNPRSLVVRQALAKACRATGNANEAAEHAEFVARAQGALQRADQLATRIMEHPNDSQTRYEIGAIYLQYAVPERGIQWLKSAVDCDPNHKAARQLLDEFISKSDDPDASTKAKLNASEWSASESQEPSGGTRHE